MRLFPQARSRGHVSTLWQAFNSSSVKLTSEFWMRKCRESCSFKRTKANSLRLLESFHMSQENPFTLYQPLPIAASLEWMMLTIVESHAFLRNKLVCRGRKIFPNYLFTSLSGKHSKLSMDLNEWYLSKWYSYRHFLTSMIEFKRRSVNLLQMV